MSSFKHWNEFQWENEIRRHENMVAGFFQDLVYCLDLPIGDTPDSCIGEAGMPSDPVSAYHSDALRQWISEHEDEGENENTPDSDMRRPGYFSCVEALDQLAAKWNSTAIIHSTPANFTFALGINCAFAKLLARTADFTDPERAALPALQITLGKRAIFDLEELVDRLKEFRRVVSAKSEIDYFIDRLAIVRDQLISGLSALRKDSIH